MTRGNIVEQWLYFRKTDGKTYDYIAREQRVHIRTDHAYLVMGAIAEEYK